MPYNVLCNHIYFKNRFIKIEKYFLYKVPSKETTSRTLVSNDNICGVFFFNICNKNLPRRLRFGNSGLKLMASLVKVIYLFIYLLIMKTPLISENFILLFC